MGTAMEGAVPRRAHGGERQGEDDRGTSEAGGCSCSGDGRRRWSSTGRGEGRLPAVLQGGLHGVGARRLGAVGRSSSKG